MPLPGIHTARQIDPGQCDTIRMKEIVAGITFNYCIHAGKADVQSVHFDASKFTPEEAKDWLKKHDFKADQFEPATPDKARASVDVPDLVRADVGSMGIRASYGTGTCEIEAAAGSAAMPRVNMLAYTGVPMKLEGFHLPMVVDLESLKVPRTQKVPILRSHDDERTAGHTDSIDISAQRLKASGLLSGMPEHNADLPVTSRNGFPWQVSIGAQTTIKPQYVPAGETEKVNGRVWHGPLLVARHAILRELSILSMGSDSNTDATFAAMPELKAAGTQGG